MTLEIIGNRKFEGGKKAPYSPEGEINKVKGSLRGFNNEFNREENDTIKKNLLRSISAQLMVSTLDDEIRGEVLSIEKEIDSAPDLNIIQEKMKELADKIFTKK